MKKYVKEYKGHKVPEGASCFVEACEAYKNHFGKTVDGVDYVFVVDNKEPEWVEILSALPLLSRGAIELPEVPQEWSGEGLPPIGIECEFTDDMNVFEVCIPRFLGDKTCIIDLPRLGAFESYFPIKLLKFRPLKTQQEKEREAFIGWAKSGLSYRLEERSFANQIIEQLADNLSSMPKAAENEY